MRQVAGKYGRGAFLIALAGLFLGSCLLFSPEAAAGKAARHFKIGLAVLKDNPDYHMARTAFVGVLEQQEEMTVEFKLLDAYGDLDAYKLGLERFVSKDRVDLIFTTGTRSTLPATQLAAGLPIVFTAVAAPVRSGIVQNLDSPGGNVTGTQCAVPAYAQMRAMMKLLPRLKTIGIVYTRDEPNAEIQTRDFIEAGEKLGVTVLTSTVSKACKTEAEVAEAARKLVGKVDVLVAHQDTSLSRYGRGMIEVAEESNIPTYVSLGQLLSRGATFSLSIDFRALGILSGQQAVKILKEKVAPGVLPVETDKNYSLIINLASAKKIGLIVPVQVLRSATKIIK